MKFLTFIKSNAVMVIALLAAFVTCFFVPPDRGYFAYFDLKTLTCLFCTLAVICALKNIHFFRIIANKIVRLFKTERSAILALVYITFIGSMLIANDMALLTFLPLGYFVLHSTNKTELLSFTFIMQTVAANLGGMLTPFGNPQNLYLYSYYQIANGEFVKIMFLPFLISITLITLCCYIFVRNKPLIPIQEEMETLNVKRTAIYLVLFALSIAIVFRVIPYYWGLLIIPPAIFILDRNALKQVDYPLLLTFFAFFVFSGNVARIPAIHALFDDLVGQHTLLSGILSCQFISNVPSAVLLSKFTQNYQELLVAVNIGGAGTLIASLASLITFKEYNRRKPGHTGAYIRDYSLFNFGFLSILTFVMSGVFA